MAAKPKVLVLGGVGFIGRNLVTYLVESDLCSYIRVVDKVLPATAFLGAPHAAAFANPIVDYKQCNLASDAGVNRAYTLEEAGAKFDVVVNLAAETKYGQTDEVYNEKILGLSVKVAQGAVRFQAGRFIEVSTAQVYESSSKKAAKEATKLDPWTSLARYKLQAEQALRNIEGLPLVVLRPSIVYGPGDCAGIAPRVIIGAVYKHLGKKMKLLWDGSFRLNTVYVRDVSRAIWHVAFNVPVGSTWNVSDKGDTTQDSLNTILERIFGIRTTYAGKIMSTVASKALKEATEYVNDKHLKPWSDLCKNANIANTPLTPYLDPELLSNNSTYIDGTAIEGTGFTYESPIITEALIRQIQDYYVQQNLFPVSS